MKKTLTKNLKPILIESKKFVKFFIVNIYSLLISKEVFDMILLITGLDKVVGVYKLFSKTFSFLSKNKQIHDTAEKTIDSGKQIIKDVIKNDSIINHISTGIIRNTFRNKPKNKPNMAFDIVRSKSEENLLNNK